MSSFLDQFRGNFKSALRWHDLDELWKNLRQNNHGQWYAYHIGEAPPVEPISANELDTFLNAIDKLLREEHEEDYCGIVYADDLKHPGMVKIFDPHNLGVVCGYSNNPPLPGWVLSTEPPENLQSAFPPPGNRRRWWQKLFDSM